eukprot:1209642-Rhodomonas_salina.2
MPCTQLTLSFFLSYLLEQSFPPLFCLLLFHEVSRKQNTANNFADEKRGQVLKEAGCTEARIEK